MHIHRRKERDETPALGKYRIGSKMFAYGTEEDFVAESEILWLPSALCPITRFSASWNYKVFYRFFYKVFYKVFYNVFYKVLMSRP